MTREREQDRSRHNHRRSKEAKKEAGSPSVVRLRRTVWAPKEKKVGSNESKLG